MSQGRGALTRSRHRHVGWYGVEPHWQVWVEADARREHGVKLCRRTRLDRLSYRIPVEVRGRRDPAIVRIVFYARPEYDTYGLPPQEYPRVYADLGADSPHRMPDDALCLYFPHSAPERRWTPEKGLLALIDLIGDHLFMEAYWRLSGGENGGMWLGEEQPHNFPARRSA